MGGLLSRHRADDTVSRAIVRVLRAELVVDDMASCRLPPTPPKRAIGYSMPPTRSAGPKKPGAS
jgi:hypothetical protein